MKEGWGRIQHVRHLRGRSQTTFTRFWLFLTTYPPVFTFSMVWTFTKSGYFWTTYLPRLVNVVCERPLIGLPLECPFPFEFQLNDIVCQINFQVRLTLRISTLPSNEWPKTDFSQISNARTKPPTISSVSKAKSLYISRVVSYTNSLVNATLGSCKKLC